MSLITTALVRLGAALGDTKQDVIRAMARVVDDAGRATDVDQLVADAFAREETSATGLPGGIAIPHCRTTGVAEPTRSSMAPMALARACLRRSLRLPRATSAFLACCRARSSACRARFSAAARRLSAAARAACSPTSSRAPCRRRPTPAAADDPRSAGVPAAVVWGGEDRILPAANAAALGDFADVRVVSGAGHMVHMEAPGEVVAAARDVAGKGG